jgi:hypothetical protein
MQIFLSLALGLSAVVFLLAHRMEAEGLRQEVSGANGFVLTMVGLASMMAAVGVIGIVWIFDSFALAWRVAIFALIWHVAALGLSFARLMRINQHTLAKRKRT